MRQPDHEYEERSFGDIQRAIDFENSMNDLESQLYYQHLSPKEVAQQVLKATCQFYDADWCGLIQVDPPFTFLTRRTAQMDELNPTVREQEIYEEMELTPEMIKSIRTLCATCLRHFVEAKAFKIALVPSADRSMDTCTVCQTRRGHDYVVMHR